MRLNKITTHAIRILVACAQAKAEFIKVAELSAKLDLTTQNTFKVVHLLSRAGLIEAARGRYGGVMLARPAEQIRVGDVVRAMEAISIESEPGGAGDQRSDEQRFALFDEAFEAFLSVLDQTTIADMARADGAGRARSGDRNRKRGSAKTGKVAQASKGRSSRRVATLDTAAEG